ncbi:unnamed protein product [Tilletia controversa]|uniref:Uncharacterized protein n=1 Tax=Tilletia controversa TaxID=13291 RepID=A0A8X7SZ21_9BASI|nr:hypothetical protein A4X06_0g2224 [Tilletia controversa]CAD6913268.1 unnamed protein product [Tilletia controversa]CAD6942871.1 unnamed protein product [Tilletia controversa]
MKRFFNADKNAPALSMLPQRNSNDFSGQQQQYQPQPQPSPSPSYIHTQQQQQQQHYFDLAAASNMYIQSVNAGPNSIQTPNALAPPSLTPPPPGQQQQQQQQYSPLPSPVRFMAGTSPAQTVDDSYTSFVPAPVSQPAASDVAPLDRNDLPKVLRSLEGLLVGLDEYRELAQKMAKIEKKIAKSASEISKIKSVRHVPSQVLGCSALHFDSLNEVDSKHAKLVQKEYEAVNDACAKYFKRVAKEERAHDELVDSLDSKIKKAHATQEKNAKRVGPRAVETHDKYIAQVSALTNDITQAKASHTASMGAKTHAISLVVASAVGGLADARFRSTCESVRKTGKEVGPLNAWLNFAVTEAMPDQQPFDLDDDELGPAARMDTAQLQAQAQYQAALQLQAQAQAQAQTQAQSQATQAFAQDQTQLLPGGGILTTRQQIQADETPVATMRSIAPSQAESSRHEPVQSIKFADLPKLDSNGRLVPAEPSTMPIQATQDFRERANIEPILRKSDEKSQGDSKQESQKAVTTIYNSAPSSAKVKEVVEEAEDEVEQSRDRADASPRAGTASRPMSYAQNDTDPHLDLPNHATQLHRTATGSTVRSAVGQPDFRDDPRSSVLNLAASLTIPDNGNDPIRDFSASSSSKEGSRRDESDSTPSLTNSTSRPSSEESAPVASPRPYFANRNPGVINEGVEVDADGDDDNDEMQQAASREYDRDRERYAPNIGQSRIASVSVSRTLSTDTTASERSFVARMKQKYQAEKEGLRQAALVPAQVVPPYGGPGSVIVDMPPTTRRVSDLASQYSPRHSYPAGGPQHQQQQLQPPSSSYGILKGPRNGLSYDDGLASTTSSVIRDPPQQHYSSTAPSGGSAAGSRFRAADPYLNRYEGGANEFGSVKSTRSGMGLPAAQPPSQRYVSGPGSKIYGAVDEERGDEAPHSDVCGCQRCSARHYNDAGASVGAGAGGGGGAGRPPPGGGYSSGSYRFDRDGDPRALPNVRRQTMPMNNISTSSSSAGFNYGSTRLDPRERERDPVGASSSYGAHFMRAPPQSDRFGNREREEREEERLYGAGASGGARQGDGRTSPYAGILNRDETRFGQGRAPPIR